MTRDADNKMGNDDLDEYSRKGEARFDKQARAKRQQGGNDKTPPGVDPLRADDGGEHRF